MKYEILNKLDQGGDANVYNCVDISNNKNYIMKTFEYNDNNFIDPIILREIAVLNKNSTNQSKNNTSKYIPKVIDIVYDNNSISVIEENYGDTILKHICDNRDIDRHLIVLQLIESVNYLHSIGYIHGDINFKNILFNDHNKITTLIDYCSATKSHRINIIHSPTLYVCPIEIYRRDNIIDLEALDIWMIGCCIYFLETVKPLILSPSYNSYREIYENKKILNHCSQIVRKILTIEPTTRKTVKFLIDSYIDEFIKYKIIPSNIDNITNDIFTHESFDPNNKHKSIRIDYTNEIRKLQILYKPTNLDINETLMLAIKNCSYLTEQSSINFIICFWLSLKLTKINNEHNKIGFLTNLIESICNSQIDQTVLKDKVFVICDELKWDLDPVIAYDGIKYVPVAYRNQFTYLVFLLHSVDISERDKYNIVAMILNSYYDLTIDMKFTDQRTKTSIVIDVLLYLKSYQHSIINSDNNDNEDNEWFQKMDFKKIYAKILKNLFISA